MSGMRHGQHRPEERVRNSWQLAAGNLRCRASCHQTHGLQIQQEGRVSHLLLVGRLLALGWAVLTRGRTLPWTCTFKAANFDERSKRADTPTQFGICCLGVSSHLCKCWAAT